MTSLRTRPTLRPTLWTKLRGTTKILVKEVGAFGLIGVISFAIDLAIFVTLAPHGALKAKLVSTVVSTTFAYFGNRYLSFSHRARTGLGREAAFFFGINFLTLIFSELVLALFAYGFGFGHASRALLIVNIATIVVSTLFRFWAYKRFVFLHPDRVHADEPELDTELAE